MWGNNTAPVRYIGIDMAWSGRNASGAATLAGLPGGAALEGEPELLGSMDEIVAYIARAAGEGPAIVAVDAPLLVPNQTGRRPAEAELGEAFQRFEAGAHPANRGLLARGGEVRGEELVKRLLGLKPGFRHVDRVEAGEGGRLVTEVYPHAAMVGMFGLEKTLKYKARPGRSEETRHEAWRRYQALLAGLGAADPPLRGHEALLRVEVPGLRGRALKGYEDKMDALLCAYIALYAHRWGAERCRTFGDLDGGYIFTPVPEGLSVQNGEPGS